MINIQYCSDIHLEFYNHLKFKNHCEIIELFESIIKPKAASYLVLAGDIGQPHLPLFSLFFEWCSKNWTNVYYVTGNHEYYSPTNSLKPMDIIENEIANKLSGFDNIHWCSQENNMSHDISGTNITIIGATLWTDINNNDFNAKSIMMDYRRIGKYDNVKGVHKIEPKDVSELHKYQRKLLESKIELGAKRGRHMIVVTHHMPSFELIADRFKYSDINHCFASNCDDLIQMPNVIAWIYGHTHDVSERKIGNCICAVNAIGYPGEKKTQHRIDVVLQVQ